MYLPYIIFKFNANFYDFKQNLTPNEQIITLTYLAVAPLAALTVLPTGRNAMMRTRLKKRNMAPKDCG